jgi:Fungal hydrophobin
MFSKVALLVAAAMAAFVVATPIPGDAPQCNTGAVQCCQQVYQSQSTEGTLLASVVGFSASDISSYVGAQCSPISVLALAGGAQW